MYFLFAISLIVLGLLAIPSLVLAKKPDAKPILDKIEPYQGWFGLIAAVWGLFNLIRLLMYIQGLTVVPLLWLSMLAACLLMVLLGFLLGYSVLNKILLSKNEEAKEKGEQVLAKIKPFQEKLGLAGIAFGVYLIIIILL